MYGSTNSPRQLARTIIVGENANLVVELLYLLTYFLRCSNIDENDLRIETPLQQRVDELVHEEATYENYTSSWNEAMFNSQSSGSDVHSWIDNITSAAATTSETLKDNLVDSTTSVELRNSEPSTCGTSACGTGSSSDDVKSEDDFVEDLDSSRCYCTYLQTLQGRASRRNTMKVIRGTGRDKFGTLLQSLRTKKTSTSKSIRMLDERNYCMGCEGGGDRTGSLRYCERCDQLMQNICLTTDSCDYCLVQLERLNDLVHRTHTTGGSGGDNVFTVPSLPPAVLSSTTKMTRRKSRNTFCVKSDVVLHCTCFSCTTTNNNEQFLDDGEGKEIPRITTSPVRKLSPHTTMEYIQSPELHTKALRHSTTSHDSGTEMACSVTSSCPEMESTDSMNLTRDSSMSSRDNLFSSDTVTGGDMDSDYCSVENERTSVKSSEVGGLSDSELMRTVCKSTSSTTIKEVYVGLDSSTMNTIVVDSSHESCELLDTELESMNFRQVPLSRYVQMMYYTLV